MKEYLEARNGVIPEKEALLIAEQVLDGLGAVHEEKVVHRDMDPNNVYLADDGTGVLLDFGGRGHGGGRAHAEHVGRSQARLRALTGYKPPEAAARILDDELAPPNELVPSLSDAPNDAILKGLSVRPDDRPQSEPRTLASLPSAARSVGGAKMVRSGDLLYAAWVAGHRLAGANDPDSPSEV